jgi:type I restriction enzyme S subunit
LTQDTVKLQFSEPNQVLQKHLFWVLRTPHYRAYCAGRATGSAQVGLSRHDFLDYPIPPINSTTLRIVDLLEQLEQKTELNRQMNRTLEEMAQAIFKSWFIDFDGDDDLVDSELGPIPRGWKVETIGDAVSLIIDHRGKTPKKLGGIWSKQGFPAISGKNIKGGRLIRRDAIRFVDEDLYHRWMKVELRPRDILLTSEGPLGELLYLASTVKYCLSQRLFGIRANGDTCLPEYLYLWLGSTGARADMEGRATGTTVLGIRQSELRKVAVLLPPRSIQDSFVETVIPVLVRMDLNEYENETLAELRDTLLPKLISGEIRIPEAEEIVEDAV